MEMDTGNEESSPPGVLGEHCYCKYPPSHDEPMETKDTPVESMETSTSTSPTLTSLDKSLDNFESLLLMLMRAYTLQTHPESSSSLKNLDTPISGEALDTLSSKQIKELITSNSVNYEVIQQILAEQKGRPAIASAARARRGQEANGGNGQLDTISLLDSESRVGLSKSPSPLRSPASSLPTIIDTNQQLQQLIQITPQQLQVLQAQVNDLLQSQRVTLPSDLSPEQQQQLIQTLLLRQLHLQQSGGVGSISLKDGSVALKQLLAESDSQKMSGESGSGVGMTVADALKNVGSGTEEGEKASKPTIMTGAAISALTAGGNIGKGRGGRKVGPKTTTKSAVVGRKKKEPAKPSKKPPLPYNLFFTEVYSTVMATKPKMGFTDVSKIISKMWAAMGPDVKKRYYEEHERLKAESNLTGAEEDSEATSTDSPTIRSMIASAPVTSGSSGGTSEQPASTPVVAVENPIVAAADGKPSGAVATESQTTSTVSVEERRALSLKATLETACPAKDPQLCANQDCTKAAVFLEDRGPSYCSNDCVVKHCRKVFDVCYLGKKIST